jgi:predicted nucleic acid-binding protein
MIVTDTGPLVAIINRKDKNHVRCVRELAALTGPLLITWPVFTEAMHFLGREVGWEAQDRLWRILKRGDLQIAPLLEDAIRRMRALMEKYRDVPMDMADASLVILCEQMAQKRIFTQDRDFRFYRMQGNKAFQIVPR